MSFIASSTKDLLSTEKRIFGYDLIRFIAIFYVFWGHGSILIPNELKEIYSWGTFLPLEGVSIFFCFEWLFNWKYTSKNNSKNEF